MKNDFAELTPNTILEAVEAFGFAVEGHFYQLNSYENRVFEVFVETDEGTSDRVILKAYRPGRWSINALNDEHNFLHDLVDEGIPAVAALKDSSGETLVQIGPYSCSVFPKARGRMPQEFLLGDLKQIGASLARIHNIGARRTPVDRPYFDAETFGWNKLDIIAPMLPSDVAEAYETVAVKIIETYEELSEPNDFIRIHGDCHKGNLLHNGSEFFFVDFDDFVTGPEAQDLWMLLDSLSDDEQIEDLKEGYSNLRYWPKKQLGLWPLLKAMRIISYAAWIATRWPSDPSFAKAFPDFGSDAYWWNEYKFLRKIYDQILEN